MATIKTKMDPDQQGFFLKDGAIAQGKVTDIAADEQAKDCVKINNTVAMSDGSTQIVDEADIFPTPNEVAEKAASAVISAAQEQANAILESAATEANALKETLLAPFASAAETVVAG